MARVTFRPFASVDDCNACVALQQEIWGAAFADHVPASLLRVITYIGGLALGAFAGDGALLGFVFGFAGVLDEQPVHWSHMLAVRQSAQGLGLGRTLKEMQRAELARRGVPRMLWTFDPLQARNAHINLNRLGVRIVDYVTNMYGITGSPLHHGMATDRLIVECATGGAAPGATPPLTLTEARAPILTPAPRAGDVQFDPAHSHAPVVLIEIPADLQVVGQLVEWRTATREHFQWALRSGYQVVRLHRDPVATRAFYVLHDGTPPGDD
jgi:predicted GNAT superfamily acetyltransferase